MVAPSSKFYDKIWVGVCLNTGKGFFSEISFYSQQKEHRAFWKTVLGIFKIALHLRDRDVFRWQSAAILNFFNSSTLKQIFWKMKTFFKNLEYGFLVESTKIANASYNGDFKMDHHKWRGFASNYLFFRKFCLSLRTSYKELICCNNNSDAHICTFCKRWTFIWWCFSLWVSVNL